MQPFLVLPTVAELAISDFLVLASAHPEHGGIILAAQSSWTLSSMIIALERLLSETQAVDWIGQVRRFYIL